MAAAPRAHVRPRAGFTLAEVAVTIAIVALALTLVVQSLNRATLTAAHTRNYRLARELALYTLGQLESRSGPFEEDLEEYMEGSYADEGEPNFRWELLLGDETFYEVPEDGSESFDYWAWRDELEADQNGTDEEDEEDQEQPFEKVHIRVLFPQIQEFASELILERWVPWDQIYTDEEQDEQLSGDNS